LPLDLFRDIISSTFVPLLSTGAKPESSVKNCVGKHGWLKPMQRQLRAKDANLIL
jgi:hypothetical protein